MERFGYGQYLAAKRREDHAMEWWKMPQDILDRLRRREENEAKQREDSAMKMQQYKYEIYFSTHEPTPDATIVEAIGTELDGYTIIQACGVWKGVMEEAYIFVYIGSAWGRAVVERIARQLRDTYKQECVFLTVTPLDVEVI
jgi:hypothetical protein